MVESAAHLIDHVLPEQPIRQWVLTFPFPLRFLFAAQPQVLTQVLGVVYRAISTHLVKKTGFNVSSGARTGAVTLMDGARPVRHPAGDLRSSKSAFLPICQRFGWYGTPAALNLNIHFHMLFLDGVYAFDEPWPTFHRAPRPTPTELTRLLRTISNRVTRLLVRQGLLIRDPERDYLDLDPNEAFAQLVGASIHYRIALGPNAGLGAPDGRR